MGSVMVQPGGAAWGDITLVSFLEGYNGPEPVPAGLLKSWGARGATRSVNEVRGEYVLPWGSQVNLLSISSTWIYCPLCDNKPEAP